MTVRPLVLSRFEDDLQDLFELSTAVFATHPYFRPIDFLLFRRTYLQLRPLLDPELVRLVYEQVKPHAAALKASGLFGPDVTPPAGADQQTELLAIFGRVA